MGLRPPAATPATSRRKYATRGFVKQAERDAQNSRATLQHNSRFAHLRAAAAFCLEQASLPTNKMKTAGRPRLGASMVLNLLRSGYTTLEYEIAQEKASALGRLGRRLEGALAALAACPRMANSDRKIRDGLVEQAAYALWLFVVQREACGLNDSTQVLRNYGVPKEVYARMGPLTRPSIQPTPTIAG